MSVVITTYNNASTLERCIRSVPFAAEILVVDSFSSDGTLALALALGARGEQMAFKGYGQQKQFAIDQARYDLVLLLDADEALSTQLANEIDQLLHAPGPLAPCRLRREEWLYWRWPARGTRLTRHLRLFDRRQVNMGQHPVHAAPQTTLPTHTLKGRLRHFGHDDMAGQLDRINFYPPATADSGCAPAGPMTAWRILLAPPSAFVREYVLRRQFLNGWAGFFAARLAALHAFLRHAKRLESRRKPSD